METLERAQRRDPMTDDAPFDPMPKAPNASARPSLWRGVCTFLGVAAIALTLGSLASLKDLLAADWRSSLANFKWIVLVSGDTVEVDEVGRFLKQIDGVSGATLLPPGAIVDQLKSEPLLAEQISVLDAASLPSVWNVSWSENFDASKLVDNLQELRRYPGVVDVAFDGRELTKAEGYRVLWLRVRVVLSALAVLAAGFLAVLFGRFLFFTDLRAVSVASAAGFLVGSALAWAAGLGLAQWLLGSVDWRLAWGAAVIAAARLAWTRVRAAE